MTRDLAEFSRAPLRRNELMKLKARALRHGIWFRVLTKTERSLVDLTIRVVERVQSFLLARLLNSVMIKLVDAMGSTVSRMTKTMGQSLVQNVSQIARSWGNKSAPKWVEDQGFIRYLVVTYINTPAMFKS